MRFSRIAVDLESGTKHCGSGLARECGVSANIDAEWHTAFASKPAPTRGNVSIRREAFQADERAGSEQIAQAAAISQTQIRRRQFGQWIENERSFLHMVVRHFEARFIDQPITEQYDVEIQRTRQRNIVRAVM